MKLEDIQKTSLRMRYGRYEYSTMSFGVSNASGVFMEYMDKIFHLYLDQFVVVFVDDIHIYSKSDEEHMGHLRIVLQTLKENQLYAKLSKCKFWLREVSFLDYEISSGGIVVDPSTIDNVLQLGDLKSVTETRGFLGLASYYMKSIKGLSKLALSLTRMIRKSQAYIWHVHYKESFVELKKKLTTNPILILPNPIQPFEEYCDASKMVLGGVLM